MYRFDDFLVDPEAWRLSRGGEEIHLEPVVLELLLYLIAHRERLVTRHELMDTVWGDTVISEAALTKAVARLRKALGDDSVTHRYLETVRSRGYRFVADVEEIESTDQSALAPGKARAAAARRATQAGAAVIIVLTILAVSWFRMPAHETPQEQVIRSLAELLDGRPDTIPRKRIEMHRSQRIGINRARIDRASQHTAKTTSSRRRSWRTDLGADGICHV